MSALQVDALAGGGPPIASDLLPVIAAAVLGLTALVLAGAVLRGPAHRRAHGLVGFVVPGSLAVAYGAIVADAPQQLGVAAASAAPLARFVAYAFALLLVAWLLARLAAAGRKLTLVLAVVTLGHVGGVAAWLLLEGPAALAAVATAGVLGLVLLYLLVGAIGGDRGAPYATLRGLLVLGWALVLATLALSPRGVGILDPYVATLVGAYVDVVLAGGLGIAIVRSGRALDRLAGVPQSDATAAGTPAPASGGDAAGVDGGTTGDAGSGDGDVGAGSGDADTGEEDADVESEDADAGEEDADVESEDASAGSEDAGTAPGPGGRPGDPEPTD